MFMTFCAIGLLNAQLLDQTFFLSRRLKVETYRATVLGNTSHCPVAVSRG